MEYIEMRLWDILAFPQSRHLLMGVWSHRDTENSVPSNIPQTGVLAPAPAAPKHHLTPPQLCKGAQKLWGLQKMGRAYGKESRESLLKTLRIQDGRVKGKI